jgi:histidine triad (HIT) family protein
MTQGSCIFCKIVRGEVPATKVYEDERTLCFMDVNPATRGHCLVILKEHRENLFELSESECLDVMATTKRIVEAVRETLEPDGLNLLQANGLQAFQTVFHFHMHVIPRYTDDGIKLPWVPRQGDPEAIRKNGARIRAFFG